MRPVTDSLSPTSSLPTLSPFLLQYELKANSIHFCYLSGFPHPVSLELRRVGSLSVRYGLAVGKVRIGLSTSCSASDVFVLRSLIRISESTSTQSARRSKKITENNKKKKTQESQAKIIPEKRNMNNSKARESEIGDTSISGNDTGVRGKDEVPETPESGSRPDGAAASESDFNREKSPPSEREDEKREENRNESVPVFGFPTSYYNFQCSADKKKNICDEIDQLKDQNSTANVTTHTISEATGDKSEQQPVHSLQFEVEAPPTIDLTPVKEPAPVLPNIGVSDGHVCSSNLPTGNPSTSRHDHVDSSPSDAASSQYELEEGAILDPENEGDAVLLNKLTSGTSDLTDDLDQLRPGCSPSPDLASTSSTRAAAVDPTGGLGQGVVSEPPCREEGFNNVAAQPEKIQDNPPKDPLNFGQEASEDSVEDISNIDDQDVEKKNKSVHNRDQDLNESEDQYKAWDDCMKNCWRHVSESACDSSGSYDPPSSPYLGGMAGLDPDLSSEWVPSYIDPNMSRSKKRRRRHQKKQEKLKKQDSLSKLMRGEQTREEAEFISTMDIGNQQHERKKARTQTEGGILSGNINQTGRGEVHDPDRSFTATFNSTKHGTDFGDSLREGSNDEELLEDDIIEDEDNNARDAGLPDEDQPDKVLNDSLSSNSTGAKRKRNRTKKTTTAKPNKAGQAPPEIPGRATRSKAQTRINEATEDIIEAGNDENKGEKEKNPKPTNTQMIQDDDAPKEQVHPIQLRPEGQVATTGASEISNTIFKQPKTMTRFDIQRLVSKAVQKSRSRTSNAFAFNSKIQKFKVITDSADIPKFPDIDPLAPLCELSVPEFIWSDVDKTMAGMVNVKSRGVIQFVILARSGLVDHEAWDTPRPEIVRDFASFLVSKISELKLEFGTILRWTNPWGNVAVMGLDSADLDKLQKFRTFFTTLKYGHQYFNTFPKDALTSSLGIYIMLKSELREFKEEYLAEALFARNQLFGVLETIEAETYTASDTTRAGVSKNGWRNVLLQGDETFLASLSAFPALHWFNIGPATVQIHGGERRAETAAEIEAKN